MPSTYYLYLDEAGNFDFSPSGSKFFIMTAVVMRRPFLHVADLASIKYDCLEGGVDPKKCADSHRFHATEDKQEVRDRVFDVITRHLGAMSIYSVIIRKNMTNPVLRDQGTIYLRVFKWLVGNIFRSGGVVGADETVVVTDSIPVRKKRNELRGALKKYMKERAESVGVPYRLYHHRSESDLNLQVADYCCWAIQRKWERGDYRSYSLIAGSIRSEGDIFRNGDTEYYSFEK